VSDLVDPAFIDEDGDPLPDGMTLKPDRLRWFFVFLIAAGFVAVAVWMGPNEDPLLFWGGGGFFLLCALIATPLMFGVGSSLTLDSKGFTCRTLFKSFRREWRACSAFYPVSIGFRKFVGFTTEQDEAAHPRIAAANREFIGASGMLPDTFGLTADDLSDLMNTYRGRAWRAVDNGQD
jgi:hypothetical protein